MKKKGSSYIYLALCLLLCILPFAGMAVYGTDETTENRTLAKLPSAEKDGSLNTDYFEELGAYFEDHFSFRKELVTMDALIQSRVFSVSNVDTVMKGTDGWLYYTDTLDDYLGTNLMNRRQVFNVANNLSLLQQYVTGQGAAFLFTVAPNKNSLYGEHMPYYAGSCLSEEKNIDLLEPELARLGVSYADLFSAFWQTDEVLYLKRDSHWNAKGALLAYNTMFDALSMEHETYEAAEAVREKKEIGDLNRMLYPLAAEPEWNYYYQNESHWNYISEPQDVEAAWIQTECTEGEGSLLMFRDSFGNTLLPLMAERFEKSAFSKGTPYLIGRYMQECAPDLVLAEKVERNLDEFMTMPPVMQGPAADLDTSAGAIFGSGEADAGRIASDIRLDMAMEDADYVVLSGELSGLEEDARIFVRLHDENGKADAAYEAFTVSTERSDYGFMLYLKKETMSGLTAGGTITVDVLAGKEGALYMAGTTELDVQVQP